MNTPSQQTTFVLTPNIRLYRWFARAIIGVLRLNGRNRFSNEFIQCLDPQIETSFQSGVKLRFRTGHGRLLWRAMEAETLEPSIIHWIDGFSGDDCFYDIGANIGTYSLYAAKRGVRAFGFEAEMNNAQLFYDNVLLNGISANCTPLCLALGDVTTLDTLYLKGISKGDALHSVHQPSPYINPGSEIAGRIDVLVMTLDDAIEQFKLPTPTKLKVDVDGNELSVIRGAERSLRTINEIHIELDLALDSHIELYALLKSRAYVEKLKEIIPTGRGTSLANYIMARP